MSKFIPKTNLAPGEMIALDAVGKLPRSIDSKFYILTITDHFQDSLFLRHLLELLFMPFSNILADTGSFPTMVQTPLLIRLKFFWNNQFILLNGMVFSKEFIKLWKKAWLLYAIKHEWSKNLPLFKLFCFSSKHAELRALHQLNYFLGENKTFLLIFVMNQNMQNNLKITITKPRGVC